MSGQPLGIDSPSRSSCRSCPRASRGVSEVPALIAVPAALGLCAYVQMEQAALFTMVVAIAAVGVFFAGLRDVASRRCVRSCPQSCSAAIAAAGRVLFAPVPDFKPVSAVCILAGAVFGRRSGFLVGALAALVSNFFFGQGPWTPWQMYAWGLVGYLAGMLADRGWLDRMPAVFAFMDSLSGLLYGLLLNSWYIVGFVHPLHMACGALRVRRGAAPRCVCTGQPRSHSCLRSTRLGAGSSSASSASTPWRTAGRRPASGRVLQCCPTDWKGERPWRRTRTRCTRRSASLRRGEAVMFPTDTVYGLGAAVDFAEGPGMLYDLKERDRGKPIAWLVGDPDDLDRYGEDVSASVRALARRFWPGPLTLVVKAAERVPDSFRSAAGTIGLRMPDDATALALIEAVGCPLATTSANRSGNRAPRSFDELDPALVERVFVVADLGDSKTSGLASTVLDCTGDAPLVVRQGAIALEDIRPLL